MNDFSRKPDRNLVAPTREIVKLERRLFMKQGLSLGALEPACRAAMSRMPMQCKKSCGACRAGTTGVQAAIFDPEQARAGISGKRDYEAVSVQRVLRRVGGAARRCGDLQAGIERIDTRESAVDAGQALCAAANEPDHAPYLRRGMERDRQVGRRNVQDVSGTRRRRPHREIRRFQVRGRLLHQHRHADGAASADAADLQVRGCRYCRSRMVFR